MIHVRTVHSKNGHIAVVTSDTVLITNVQSALDRIAAVSFETGHCAVVINKSAICEELFHLKTRLAGEIVQKFINYDVKMGIVGNFSQYTSKSRHDFIYESNMGGRIVFGPTEDAVIELLG
ncbi:MAG TPA: DUF4180 domain-containing protein [Firmicutes bacterium]|nr:DUF4180 domain-containing protein [Bacillota bacterium]